MDDYEGWFSPRRNPEPLYCKIVRYSYGIAWTTFSLVYSDDDKHDELYGDGSGFGDGNGTGYSFSVTDYREDL